MTVIFTIQTVIEIIIACSILYCIAREDTALAFVNGVIDKINGVISEIRKTENPVHTKKVIHTGKKSTCQKHRSAA